MADDQDTSNDGGEEGEVPEYAEDDIASTTLPPPTPEVDAFVTNPVVEDYADEENLPDFTVNLIINDGPDLLDAAVTDMYGNIIPRATTPWTDSINGYTGAITQEVYNELNGTDTAGGKGFLVFVNLRIDDATSQSKTGTLSSQGTWSSKKVLYVGLIALCIIAIILAIVFMVIGKFKRNKRSTTTGTTTVTKGVVTKGISPEPKYKKVESV